MHPRHYSPKTPLLLTTRGDLPRQGHGLYLRLTVDPQHPATTVVMPNDAAEYARVLYGTLHEADRQQFDWIAVEKPPESLEWEAVLDRLSRASQK
jgi:L-threonylcarbamoyladenylate synthase